MKSLSEEMEKCWANSITNLEERMNEITSELKIIKSENLNLKNQLQKKPIFFDFGLENHVYTSGVEILKFDLERNSSPDKPYNSASGVFHVTRSGLYFFQVYYKPRYDDQHTGVSISIDQEIACSAYSYVNHQSASCATVRFLKAGQHVFVKKRGQLWAQP